MTRRFVLALAGLVLMGCDGNTSRPTAVASLSILDSDGAPPPTVLVVGQTMQLYTVVRDGDGRTLTGQTITWSSSQPAVATVNGSGVVSAVGPGVAEIVASAAGRSARFELRVCERADLALSAMAVGQVATTSAACAPTIRISGGTTAAEYVLVAFHASGVAASRAAFDVTAQGVTGVVGPPSPSPLATGPSLSLDVAGPIGDESFHQRLREIERRQLTPARFTAAAATYERSMPPTFNAAAAVPEEGAKLRLNVLTREASDPRNNINACTDPRAVTQRTGVVVAVTQRAVVVVDSANPTTTITPAEYRSFGITFDTLVHPLLTETFGDLQDVDKNGRSIIFYTRGVNELTAQGSSSYVGGFFWAGDLFAKTGDNGCANSNYGEIFYMLAPDPTGAVNSNTRPDDLIRRTTVGVLGHEFQHLINASRRLYVNRSSTFEETWLNEGLSHVAEELLFFRASGLAPRQNLTEPGLRGSPRAWNAFSTYQASNYARLAEYLRNTASQSVQGDAARLETRGAAWAFLRYAADRRNGDDRKLWFDLVNSRLRGHENLRDVLGSDPMRLIQDWTTALYTDDAVPGIPAQYTTSSWHHRSVMTTLTNTHGVYPLAITPFAGGRAALSVAGGSAAYLRFGVAANGQASLTTGSGGGPALERVHLTIVRTR
jgi:hypothetical protein